MLRVAGGAYTCVLKLAASMAVLLCTVFLCINDWGRSENETQNCSEKA